MFKISVVFGTRPEAIKLAPVILSLKANSKFVCRICVTAQHREMLDQVLHSFNIKPDHDLNLMQSDQTLSEFTARALKALDDWYTAEKPDLVLVQGDTSTVFCAALAAFYHRKQKRLYLFRGKYVYRFKKAALGPERGYPKPITSVFKNLPKSFRNGIDAALQKTKDGSIYLFKGDSYVRITSMKKGIDGCLKIKSGWLVPKNYYSGFDAIFFDRTGKSLYIFKGNEYIKMKVH